MLDLCICTHNPRLPILRRCLEAIETQISPPPFRLLLVDDASDPPLAESLQDGLRQRGVPTTLIREQRLGLTAARVAAFQQTSGEWLVFIDDDNVIAPDFLRLGVEFARIHPEVGAFGGRVSLPPGIEAPQWMTPLLGWMGVKEEGDETLINSTIEWDRHDPPGAGLWVRRVLLERFVDRTRANPAVFDLGRRGNGLASCEDAIIVKGARDLGFPNAYVPGLRVTHYLKPERFTFWHAIRSFYAYGRSIALYEQIMMLGGDHLGNVNRPGAFHVGWKTFKREKRRSIRYATTRAIYQWSYERSRRTLERAWPELNPNGRELQNLLPFLRTGAGARHDRGAIIVTGAAEAFAIYGPYWTLPPGRYEMRARIRPHQDKCNVTSALTAQVTAECGARLFGESKWRLNQYRFHDAAMPAEFRLPFSLTSNLPLSARTIETRIFVSGNAEFSLLALFVLPKCKEPENDWFSYLTVGECGIHTGIEITSINGTAGCIACTPPMAVVPGRYVLTADISVAPHDQDAVALELWSGASLIAETDANARSLEFPVSRLSSEKGLELRIQTKSPADLRIRGVWVKEASESVAPLRSAHALV